MYYQGLNFIAIREKLTIPEKKLIQVNELLCTVIPGGTISPKFISRKSNLDLNLLLTLLNGLVSTGSINILFIIECKNVDDDLIHSFEFSDYFSLMNFVKEKDKTCPNCGEQLDVLNTKVFYKTIENPRSRGENFG